jgi:FG-GAP repeat
MFRRLIPLPLIVIALTVAAATILTSSSVVQATDPFPTKRPLHEAQPETSAQLGYRVAVGDVNGDGYEDIVAATPYADVGGITDTGEVTAFLGPCFFKSVTLQVSGLGQGANFGRGLAVGNVGGSLNGNNQPIDDIVVGAPYWGNATDPGKVYVFYGSTNIASRTSADITLQDSDNPENGEDFGWSVAIGNVGTTANSSTDAYADVIVGAPFKNYYWGQNPQHQITMFGRAFVFFGPTPGSSGSSELYPSDATNIGSPRFGYNLAVGQFDPTNPDGTTYSDILVDAGVETVNGLGSAGAVHLYQGRKSFSNPVTSENAKLVADTPTSSGFFGTRAIALGDA